MIEGLNSFLLVFLFFFLNPFLIDKTHGTSTLKSRFSILET
ncbi:hypothetical protein CHCC14819_0698 [Bacillus licheniformis]|nr:hypothetical protein CHCC14819_0698 [Bacillus licheniformis]